MAPPRKPAAPVRCYALAVPGIEDLAAAEIAHAGGRPGDVLAKFDRRESIVMFTAPEPSKLLRAGLQEDVFIVLLDAPTPAGARAPRLFARRIERRTLEAAMALHHAARPKRGGRTFKVVARAAGRQSFRREDLEGAVARAVGVLLPRWTCVRDSAALEVWVHAVGPRMIAGLRLSGDELAQRRYKRAHLPASLKPTVARALATLAGVRPGDVFIDPMAGAGTILRERADAGPARAIIGGDTDAVALGAAATNVGRSAGLVRWDATRLPLRSGSVDAIVTNPPYGRQHEVGGGIERLYRAVMREAARVLRPDGRCVVLTGEPRALSAVLPASLRVRSKRRLLVRGLAVTAFVMVRA